MLIIAAMLATTAVAMYRTPLYRAWQNFAASMILGLALWACIFWATLEVFL